MPGTSSAVPADLIRFARTVEADVAGSRAAAAALNRSAAGLASARPVGLGGIDLAALAGRLHRQTDRAAALADRVRDLAHAFALAGGEASGEAGGHPLGLKGGVIVDERFLAACRRLPGGRPRTLAELQAMSYAERLRWLLRLLAGGLVPDDANFRALAGILAAAHASGRGGLWDDECFRIADAAVLESVQLGVVAAAAGGRWRPAPRDPRAVAVDAWVDYLRTGGDEGERDSAWAFAEELAVRYGEAVAADRGLRFHPDLETFVRFGHVYRGAVRRNEQRALLGRIVGEVDPVALARLAERVREVVLGRIDDLIALPIETVFDWIRLRLRSPLDPFELVFGGLDRGLRYFPLTSGVPPVSLVVTAAISAVVPEALATLVLDPEATPPPVVASVLDEVLEVEPPMPDAPASYYVALLVDRGYLRGLPTTLPEAPGAVPRMPGY